MSDVIGKCRVEYRLKGYYDPRPCNGDIVRELIDIGDFLGSQGQPMKYGTPYCNRCGLLYHAETVKGSNDE